MILRILFRAKSVITIGLHMETILQNCQMGFFSDKLDSESKVTRTLEDELVTGVHKIDSPSFSNTISFSEL